MTLASVEGSRRHVVVVAAAMDEADDIEEIYERLHCAVLAPHLRALNSSAWGTRPQRC